MVRGKDLQTLPKLHLIKGSSFIGDAQFAETYGKGVVIMPELIALIVGIALWLYVFYLLWKTK
jgi:hypothetical protein